MQSSALNTLLAFAFGTIFVIVILYFATAIQAPTDFQLFVFRVVLAIAAAGVAAVIPVMLEVTLKPIIVAGGAIAVFALVYLVNPPKLFVESKISHLADRANLALVKGNLGFAKLLYERAVVLNPEDYHLVLSLAQTEAEIGNFAVAESLYKQAYEMSKAQEGKEDPSILYGLSLAYETQGMYAEAIANYEDIEKKSFDNKLLHNDVGFSKAQLLLLKGLQDGNIDLDRLRVVEGGFLRFIESGGKPVHWAYYHLSCVDAVRSRLEKGNGDSAIANLEVAIVELKKSKSRNAARHYEMLVQLLNPKGFHPWYAGDPVRCDDLRTLVRSRRPDLIAAL
jgi:tetratricopeptide (TPR) repeat protein